MVGHGEGILYYSLQKESCQGLACFTAQQRHKQGQSPQTWNCFLLHSGNYYTLHPSHWALGHDPPTFTCASGAEFLKICHTYQWSATDCPPTLSHILLSAIGCLPRPHTHTAKSQLSGLMAWAGHHSATHHWLAWNCGWANPEENVNPKADK